MNFGRDYIEGQSPEVIYSHDGIEPNEAETRDLEEELYRRLYAQIADWHEWEDASEVFLLGQLFDRDCGSKLRGVLGSTRGEAAYYVDFNYLDIGGEPSGTVKLVLFPEKQDLLVRIDYPLPVWAVRHIVEMSAGDDPFAHSIRQVEVIRKADYAKLLVS